MIFGSNQNNRNAKYFLMVTFFALFLNCHNDGNDPFPDDWSEKNMSNYSMDYDYDLPLAVPLECLYNMDLIPIEMDIMSVQMSDYVADNPSYEQPWAFAYDFQTNLEKANNLPLTFYDYDDDLNPLNKADFSQDVQNDLIAGIRLKYKVQVANPMFDPQCNPINHLSDTYPIRLDITLISKSDFPVRDDITIDDCRQGRFFATTYYSQYLLTNKNTWIGGDENSLVTIIYDKYGYPNGEYWNCAILNQDQNYPYDNNYQNNFILSNHSLTVTNSGEEEDLVIIRAESAITDNTDTFCTLHEFNLDYDITGTESYMTNYVGFDSYPGMDESFFSEQTMIERFVIGGPYGSDPNNTNGTMSSLCGYYGLYNNDDPYEEVGLRSCGIERYLPRDTERSYYLRVQLSPHQRLSLDIGSYCAGAWTPDGYITPPMLCSGLPQDLLSPLEVAEESDVKRVLINDFPDGTYLDTIEDFDWYRIVWN